MVKMTVKCPDCASEDIVRQGKSRHGIQVYRCRNKTCSRTKFQLEYKYKACYAGTTEKIVQMAVNGSGISDTERMLGIHHTTIISRLKKTQRCTAGKLGVSEGSS